MLVVPQWEDYRNGVYHFGGPYKFNGKEAGVFPGGSWEPSLEGLLLVVQGVESLPFQGLDCCGGSNL